MPPDSEFTRINSFFGSFNGREASDARNLEDGEDGGERTITTGGNYFDEKLAMDGKVRMDAEGKGSAVFPPPFGSSHASNIIVVPASGDLLCAWFSGDAEGGDGVAIVVARLPAGSDQWTPPRVASRAKHRSAQNPVMFVNAAGDVCLLHTSQEAFMGQGTSEVRRVVSKDGGKTWGEPASLFKTPGAFVKNHALWSADRKEILLPMYYTPDGFFAHETQYSSVQRSADGGKTWRESAPMRGTLGKLVQPTVVRLKSGRLLAFYRSRAADAIYKSHSDDDGETWSEPKKTPLPNNNSGIQAAMLSSGAIAIVFNNLRGEYARWPLSIALSEDEGETWGWVRDLEPDGAAGEEGGEDLREAGSMGEYSYPSLVEHPPGTIHVAYTFRRETVRYCVVPESWIKGGRGTVGLYKPGGDGGGVEGEDEDARR